VNVIQFYVVYATLVSSWIERCVMAQDEACCDCLKCVGFWIEAVG